MQEKKTFDREFFVEKGKEGAERRNKLYNPSEITMRGWATRRKNLDKTAEDARG